MTQEQLEQLYDRANEIMKLTYGHGCEYIIIEEFGDISGLEINWDGERVRYYINPLYLTMTIDEVKSHYAAEQEALRKSEEERKAKQEAEQKERRYAEYVRMKQEFES